MATSIAITKTKTTTKTTTILCHEEKIKRLLNEFLTSPKYNNCCNQQQQQELSRSDVYFNTLLSYLSGKENKELGDSLLNLPALTEWIIEAVTLWEKQHKQQQNIQNNACSVLKSFGINLTALLTKNESKFLYLHTSENIYNRLFALFDLSTSTTSQARLSGKDKNSNSTSPTIKLAFIKLLSACLNHESGINFIIQNNTHWKTIYKFCLTNQTIYITREGYSFIYNLIAKTGLSEINFNFAENVIKEIVKPLSNTSRQIQFKGPFPEIREELLFITIMPTLTLLKNIFELHFESKTDFRLFKILLMNSELENQLWLLKKTMIVNKEILLELHKCLMMCFFAELASTLNSNILDRNEMRKAGRSFLQLVNDELEIKNERNDTLKLCYYFHYIWQHLKDFAPAISEKDHEITFENQMIVLQILPIFSVSLKHCCLSLISLETDDIREHFVTKLFKIMCEKTIRLAYNWRKVYCEKEENQEVFPTAQIGLNYVMKSTQFFTRNAVIIIFQAIMYALKDIAHALKESYEAQETFSKQSTYMITLIESASELISKYEISWRDCIETICVMTNATDLLSCPIWPHRLIVSLLKLINLSITKFMSPNLALLVDQGNNNMDVLGPLLYMKLHDRVWEVRDTALEIVQSICNISQTKFLSLQKVILDSELPSLVVVMAISDSESYVRASAIKCLLEMIQVNEFWISTLEKEDLLKKMLKLLKNEEEANVRCEAASLICKLYEHQHIEDCEMPEVYEIMCVLVISDLHWEVKINALNFWEKVILSHLQNQGMIDGTFPNVTFSKEHRKIVTLTEIEVQNRLNKVLLQLDQCKCLTALHSCLNVTEECDLQVTKVALNIVKKLASLLKTYNLTSIKSDLILSPQISIEQENILQVEEEEEQANIQQQNPTIEFSDAILDEIINSKDINLLNDVYIKENQEENFPKSKNTDKIKIQKTISAQEFVSFIQQEEHLNSLLKEKEQWLMNGMDNLNSLLDDMLKSYNYNQQEGKEDEKEDINSMDCY